jgi:hypothetical protein
MKAKCKIILVIGFLICYKFSLANNRENFKLTLGSTYNYRAFNSPRYKKGINRTTSELESVNARMNNYNKYKFVLDSIDVPVIAPSLGFYYENKMDTISYNGFIFRTGLQLGIKDHTIKARKVYYYNDYKYATGPVDSAIVGMYQHPMWGIPITGGYKLASKNNKFQFSLSAGPVINFWLGYSRFKTYKSQQQSIFNYYKPTRDLGYDDFKIADTKSHLFFDANIRWQAQLALDYKISKKWMLGLFCWWEDTIFQRKNGSRAFYRNGSEKKYAVDYRRRFYSGNVSISLTRMLK